MSPQRKKVSPLTVEDAQLIYKNFSGTARTYNAAGLRNFNIILDHELAKVLENDGWKIRWKQPREEGDPVLALLKVSVRFDNYPPRIVMITKSGGRVDLDKKTVGILDDAEIETIDLVVTGSFWERNGESGIKAYLKKAFVTLSPQDLESKYADNMQPAKRVVDADDD